MTQRADNTRFAPPTLSFILETLQHTLGMEDGITIWQSLCDQLELHHERDEADLTTVQRAAEWLLARQDLAKLVGCSVHIRLLTFHQLRANKAAQQSQG